MATCTSTYFNDRFDDAPLVCEQPIVGHREVHTAHRQTVAGPAEVQWAHREVHNEHGITVTLGDVAP